MPLISSFRRLSPSGTRNKWPLPPTSVRLDGPRLFLRLGQPLDWQAWRDLREESKDFLTPWEPKWPGDALTFDYYSKNLRRQWREWKDGQDYSFLIFLKENKSTPFSAFGQKSDDQSQPLPPAATAKLVGGITLCQIERGAAQRGKLGYWIGQSFARQGLMTEAVDLVMGFGFETLLLHRIEADCMPNNEPSKGLLSKLGFTYEGLAKSYLRINGAWEDHLLWSFIRPD